jgi:hypothetical protein
MPIQPRLTTANFIISSELESARPKTCTYMSTERAPVILRVGLRISSLSFGRGRLRGRIHRRGG